MEAAATPLNYDWITAQTVAQFLLILARVSGAFLSAPFLSHASVSPKIKIAIVLMITFLLSPILPHPKVNLHDSNLQLIILVLQEALIGVVLGFAASVIYSILAIAGDFIGFQMGYSIATVLDPSQGAQTGVIATFVTTMGALLFLYLNGHHLVLTAIAKSFEVLPIGKGFDVQVGYQISAFLNKIFALSIQMAAPFIIVFTIVGFIFGIITKLSPQMNIYFNVGFIASPVLGLALLMLSLPLIRVLMTQLTEQMGPDLLMLVRALKGA